MPNIKFLSISKAAKLLQVSPDTLRNWERQGKLIPARTSGGARRYSTFELLAIKKEVNPTPIRRKGLLNVSQAAKELQISADTLRNWTVKGLIDNHRTKGGARRFTRSEIKRVQNELGIEAKKEVPVTPVTMYEPKFQPEIHRFSFPWKIIFSATVVLILFAGLLLSQSIEAYGKKVTGVAILAEKLAKSVESLQSGVYGIQTEMIPSPNPSAVPSSTIELPPEVVSNVQFPSLIQSAKAPLILDKGVISCSNCLTDSSTYISNLDSDDSINLDLGDKTVKVSLETNHTNNWSVSQSFSAGAIFSGGNVGIGITAPNAMLAVGGNVGIGATTSSNKLDVWGNARITGSLTVDDSIYSNPADLAEMYGVYGQVEEGDLVELTGDSQIGFGVQRATNVSGKRLIGIISTKPGSVLGYDAALAVNQKPVALAGRVPLKVSDENGPIEVGDYLTASSIPGVAMKATKPGVTIGQALEAFASAEELSSGSSDQVYFHARIGKILTFVNVTYADPTDFFASLSIDDQGNLIAPKAKSALLVLEPSIVTNEPTLSEDQSDNIAPLEAIIASSSAELAGKTDLNLTPPDILLATGSATLANIEVTDTLSSDKLIIASDSKILGDLKVFGKTTLGETLIAGNLTVDGALSIENGSEINVIGTLYLQKSSLAQGLDLLNGKVTVDKEGNVRAQIVTVAEFRVVAGKISGSSKIVSASKSAEIESPIVGPNSRILITPTSETNLILAVTKKVEGKSFTVSSPQITTEDIVFDWFMVNETQEEFNLPN